MKITSHNKTFEWLLRLVEWRYAQASLLGTALLHASSYNAITLNTIITWAEALRHQLFHNSQYFFINWLIVLIVEISQVCSIVKDIYREGFLNKKSFTTAHLQRRCLLLGLKTCLFCHQVKVLIIPSSPWFQHLDSPLDRLATWVKHNRRHNFFAGEFWDWSS